MKNKIAFILDDKEVYLKSKTLEIASTWGFSPSEILSVKEYKKGLVPKNSLFGKTLLHLDLSNKDDLKRFAKIIKEDKKKNQVFTDDWFFDGIIITSIHAQGSKEITDLVSRFSGEVIKKAKVIDRKKELLNKIQTPTQIKNLISEFVGEDYDLLFSIINNINNLSPEEKKNLTINNIEHLFPSQKGSVVPWLFISDLFSGNSAKAIENLDRYLEKKETVLIPLTVLKNKTFLLYKYTLLKHSGIKRDSEIAQILGENLWSLKDIQQLKKTLKIETVEYLCKLVYETEVGLKGGQRNLSEDNYFRAAILKYLTAVNYDTKF